MSETSSFQCPVKYTLSIIGGKWKPVILWKLAQREVLRYGEIKKEVAGITHKMLSHQLKELEADGMINRKEFHQIPPKVEYSLTDKGMSLMPVLETMCQWGREHSGSALRACPLSRTSQESQEIGLA